MCITVIYDSRRGEHDVIRFGAGFTMPEEDESSNAAV